MQTALSLSHLRSPYCRVGEPRAIVTYNPSVEVCANTPSLPVLDSPRRRRLLLLTVPRLQRYVRTYSTVYTPVGKYIDVLRRVVTGLRYTTYSTYWTCFPPPAGTGTQVVRTEYVQFVKNFFSVR